MAKQNTAIQVTAIISGVILIVALAILFTFNSANSRDNTINVEGLARVKAMPDEIGVYFNIQTEGDTSSEAKDANSEILNKLVAFLQTQGFSREDIVTESFNIYPNYEWEGGDRKENGFIATHSVSVRVDSDESDKLGGIIDAGVDAGAGISFINFELSLESQNKYKAQAIELAAEDARNKAEAIANGFNKEVGKLVSVSVNDFEYYPWNVFSASGVAEDSMQAKEAVSNIQPGEREVTARVTAVYKLN